MKQITCPHCGDTYPDFDVAHVCSKGPYAPKLKPKMNERINGLWWKARIGYNEQNCDPEVLEKFAELIVAECARVIVNGGYWSGGPLGPKRQCTPPEIATMIKEHFGVESTSIKVGSRVKVVSGFNVGAKGTVSYIEPTGRMWVMRDGASTDVFYTPDEVVRIEQ